MEKKEMGHTFLARLGKTRLRPGGRKATDWLIANSGITAESKVLEVACNMGTTAIGLAKRFGCKIEGIDLDEKVLVKARENIAKNHLEQLINVQRANAVSLPFDDNTFDVVINEAMLTMLPFATKQKAVAEYLRVLKPGGVLLTHDVMLTTDNAEEILKRMHEAINVNATPLTKEGWTNLFAEAGFESIETLSGDMTLMSPRGMIYDEGFFGTLRIIRNAMRSENRKMFKRMFSTFNAKPKKLNFIAVASRKQK